MPQDRGVKALGERQRQLAFATIMLAFIIDVVDSTIVNTAIPAIQADLGAADNAVQWVIAGYFLSFAVLLIAGGRLGDLFGYRRMFLIGVTSFTVASMACGLSADAGQLVIARMLQGATAAIMAPQVVALVQVMYAPIERVGRLALFGVIGGLAAILGPIVGGLLIALDPGGLGWRSIFLINAPIGLAAIVAGWHLLPEGRSPHPLKIDMVGTSLAFLTLTMLLVPLIQGREAGWPWWCFAMIATSLCTGAIFCRHQQYRQERTGSALIEPGLFRERTFTLGLVTTLFFSTASAGFLMTFSLTLQHGLGYSALKTALLHMPFGLGVMAGISQVGRRLLPSRGKWVPIAGGTIMAPSCVAVALTLANGGSPVIVSGLLFLTGLGMGTLAGPMAPITLARVDRGHAGVAGGTHKAVQQVGGALGGAGIGLLYFLMVERAQNAPFAYRAAFPTAALAIAGLLSCAVFTLWRLPQAIFVPTEPNK